MSRYVPWALTRNCPELTNSCLPGYEPWSAGSKKCNILTGGYQPNFCLINKVETYRWAQKARTDNHCKSADCGDEAPAGWRSPHPSTFYARQSSVYISARRPRIPVPAPAVHGAGYGPLFVHGIQEHRAVEFDAHYVNKDPEGGLDGGMRLSVNKS